MLNAKGRRGRRPLQLNGMDGRYLYQPSGRLKEASPFGRGGGVADGEGKRREITLSVTVGDSSPEGRADCNARSHEEIIVCAKTLYVTPRAVILSDEATSCLESKPEVHEE